MKNRKLIAGLIGVTMTIPMMTIPVMADTGEIDIDQTNFPDDIFRKFVLEEIDSDGNGKLNPIERSIDFITVESMGISSLKGIEYFTNLNGLFCSCNKLTSLDVSKNTSLTGLFCYDNQLTSLDVSNNPALTNFECDNNQLTSIDISNNRALVDFRCSGNKLSSINVRNNRELVTLTCSENNLTNLDISNNPLLEVLSCYDNQLTSLDISRNPSLVAVYCNTNQLTTLNTSNNPRLVEFECYENQITSLDTSNNPELDTLFCYDNKLTSLNVSNNLSLGWLWCSYNQIPSLDVSRNTSMVELWCENNKLTNLDVSNSTRMMSLHCYGNQLTSIDISKNLVLHDLICDDNIQVNLNEDLQPLLGNTPAKITTKWKNYYFISNDIVVHANGTAPFDSNRNIIFVSNKTTGVDGFAKRLYTCALNREFDRKGEEYWANALRHGTTGADVARGFLFSPEVENANLSNDEFVIRVYLTLLDRVPADNEVAYWSGLLNQGNSRTVVFDGFINSQEWANVCLSYGILSGGAGVPSFTLEPSQEIYEFATRLYTTCLSRNADEAGLNWWACEMANLRVSGSQAAQSYFFSDEFIKANVDNHEFVDRLYLTFMNRKAGKEEFDYWLNEMNNGMPRENVFAGFAGSPEFESICADYGIIR